MNFNYKPKGTCSTNMDFVIEDNIIKEFNVTGGCNGNLKGIKALIEGMDIDTVINKFDGITCGFKQTSCPDQISKALKEYKTSRGK